MPVPASLAFRSGAPHDLLGWQLVLRAADLRAFERLAGAARLPLTHPAELVLDLRHRDRAVAREFALDLSLALAEEAVRLAERETRPALRPTTSAVSAAARRVG